MTGPDRGIYTPPPDAPLSFDARDAVPVRKGPMLLIITALLVVAFVVVVWTTFKSGVRERGGPPHIAAAESPFKTTPEDAGGAIIPDQDKTVYDTVSGEETAPVESFAAAPETPMDRAAIADAPKAAPTKPVAAAPLNKPVAKAEPVEMRGPSLEGGESVPLPPAPDELASAPKPVAKPVETAAKPSGGGVAIQIGAGRDRAQAEAFWTTAVSKFPELKSHVKEIQVADLGEKGTFYRVRATGFISKAEAAAFCAKMKSAGTDCMVK